MGDRSDRTTPANDLRRSRDQLQAILGGVADAITAQDETGRVVFANPAAVTLLGFQTIEELLAAPIADVMSRYDVYDERGESLPRDRLPSYRALTTGVAVRDVLLRYCVRASGVERWSLVSANPLFESKDAATTSDDTHTVGQKARAQGVINIFRDVTERRREAEALRVSHEWFATTLRSIGDAVIATDALGHITFMNAVAEELTGWPLRDATGQILRTVFNIVNETTRAEVESPVTKVLREGTVVGLANHTILLRRGGPEIAIDDSGAPIRNAKGELVGVVLVFRDVTEKRHEEERRFFIAEASRVLASSLDFQTTLGAVARLAVPKVADWCSVHIVDPSGLFRQLAAAHVDPSKEKLARELDRLFPPEPGASHGVPNALRTGKPEVMYEVSDALLAAEAHHADELRLLRDLGISSRMIVPMTARGRTLGALTFVASRRTYAPEDLALAEQLASAAAMAIDNARLYHDAQEASRMKDEFLATVSHELRTPLNAMLGWARLIRSGSLVGDMHERALATIERNAQAQAQLIDDLLDVSRIITGKLRLDVRSIDLADVIEAAVDAVRPAAQAKGIRIEVNLDQLIGPVSADGQRLEQVVWNLLSNAVKFTSKGGRVTVSTALVSSHVELRVNDNGIGIDPDFLPLVFDRFRQADTRGTKSHTGLGLGLAIARHLVELHGGTLRAESDGIDRGATFVMELPIVPIHREDAPSPVNHALTTMEVPPLDGVRIVVVEDEADGRELLTIVLEQLGANVEAVGSAEEGLRALVAFRPHVLVSDIGMPGEDGYSLIRRVRALAIDQGGATPAVALTAYARAEDRARALLSGFQQHLTKPIEPKELAAVVANLVGRTNPT